MVNSLALSIRLYYKITTLQKESQATLADAYVLKYLLETAIWAKKRE